MNRPACENCNIPFAGSEGSVPKNLDCGHCVCWNCVTRLHSDASVVCPFCDEDTELRSLEPKELSTNYPMQKMAEYFLEQEKNNKPENLEVVKMKTKILSAKRRKERELDAIRYKIRKLENYPTTFEYDDDYLKLKSQIEKHYKNLFTTSKRKMKRDVMKLTKVFKRKAKEVKAMKKKGEQELKDGKLTLNSLQMLTDQEEEYIVPTKWLIDSFCDEVDEEKDEEIITITDHVKLEIPEIEFNPVSIKLTL